MADNTTNKELRTKLRQDPHSVFGYISKDIDIIVKTNTKETIYVVMTNLDNNSIQELAQISAAGGTAGTLTSTSSAGCLGTMTTCASTVSTAGTVGTASTVNIIDNMHDTVGAIGGK